MGCSSCASGTQANGKPSGCRSNGGCSTGGCNRMNVYDWLSDLPFSAQQDSFKIVEVSFKNGSRKGYFRNTNNIDCHTGDLVVVEVPTGGHDIGQISLSGELVRLQMRKKNISEKSDIKRLLRLPTEKDLEIWEEARKQEFSSMLLARVISRQLGLNMKIGDVEYQGDGRKATFYYTADERIDFRELIKQYAKEFKIKIEMRQIGARQEASRIGGIGTCGRELCCSTWLADFKSVSTAAARYQNLAINQTKLSGQCGRLKCCLNYELDTYLDALKDFPKDAETLITQAGKCYLFKTDIFKRLMWYSVPGPNPPVMLRVEEVKQILQAIKKGEIPENLDKFANKKTEAPKVQFEDVVGQATLEDIDKFKKKKRKKKKNKPDETPPATGGNVAKENKPPITITKRINPNPDNINPKQ
ncbi:MAG TPA: regulatory iron-sulfur-containing complex subunit RicT [Chitinophagales bacterium]|nr:regulatory iron-sulfur-containing complex subunit RicT [Chitinophagales bacterium]HRK27965.1 regulatory iron-sulfur-containing complex subunit RicT [Chitinophagales bacterium]